MAIFNGYIFGFIVFLSQQFVPTIDGLLWAQFTVFQVNCAISWPIPFKNPDRKIFFNIGFQFNYNEPFQPSNFYKPPFFQNPFTRARSIINGNYSDFNETATFLNEYRTESANLSTTREPDPEHHVNTRNADHIAGRDVTAGELYNGIEDNLESLGYDRSCLLKSICELARHPFHMRENDDNVLEEIVHFILTPSVHEGFTENEQSDARIYEEAQQHGYHGHNCDSIYSDCKNSLLERLTYTNSIEFHANKIN